MDRHFKYFATCPTGFERLLAGELEALKGHEVREKKGGVSFLGDLEVGYLACLWSRIANRVILELSTFPIAVEQDIYRNAARIEWDQHFDVKDTLSVNCSLSGKSFKHADYLALLTKDAVVDFFRKKYDRRPSVRSVRPDIQINLFVHNDRATLGLDLSGESLHRRAYRQKGGNATLKENVASALLLRSGWKEIGGKKGALIDPFCGTGTILIEAAQIAGNIAPGLRREYFGFFGWKKHDARLWKNLVQEAEAQRAAGLEAIPVIHGWDRERAVIELAQKNVNAAGLKGIIKLDALPFQELDEGVTKPLRPGLICTNPPYGERLGQYEELLPLYQEIGKKFSHQFLGWEAVVLTGNEDLAHSIGLKAKKVNHLFNGAIPCVSVAFELSSDNFFHLTNHLLRAEQELFAADPYSEMFFNRLKKNLKIIRKWARKNGVYCYRIYDADIPQYSAALDLYEEKWLHIQEYKPPVTVDSVAAAARLNTIKVVAKELLNFDDKHIFLKQRARQKGKDQYKKISAEAKLEQIREGAFSFYVNFNDYLDTGLFLDHRIIRAMIKEHADNKDFLNIFAYTGSATVYAAGGNAKTTTSVDMSNTYLNWTKKNMELNNFSTEKHRYIRANCLEWIKSEKRKYDLIFLDPPTFSNSKAMDLSFSIQHDHVTLIENTLKLLRPNGLLYFSNNFRKFKIDLEGLKKFDITDISLQTIPRDFERNPKIHYCWKIVK